jgi:putative transposase
MESFWGSMQVELLNRQHWRTHLQLAASIADYIENFYNVASRHSALNYPTPTEFEESDFENSRISAGPRG